jgi:predicted glycosyltransferase involved in capsule biosynthesis
MCKTFLDIELRENNYNSIGINTNSFQEWSLKVKKEKISTTHLDVDIYHFFHGSRENRKYIDRNKNTRLFDSSLITNINDLGILEWSDQAPEYLKQEVRDFFDNRLEDE